MVDTPEDKEKQLPECRDAEIETKVDLSGNDVAGPKANGAPDGGAGDKTEDDSAAQMREDLHSASGDTSKEFEETAGDNPESSDESCRKTDKPAENTDKGSFANLDSANKMELAKSILKQYLSIAINVLVSPQTFFKQMNLANGLTEPAVFLAVSSGGNAVLNAIFSKFDLLSIPGRFIFESIVVLILSGVTFMMAKSMGSKCKFEATFKVFAYCSCLNILAAVPGINLLTPLYGLVLNYFGLRSVLALSLQQTITVMAFACLMQMVLGIGRTLSGH